MFGTWQNVAACYIQLLLHTLSWKLTTLCSNISYGYGSTWTAVRHIFSGKSKSSGILQAFSFCSFLPLHKKKPCWIGAAVCGFKQEAILKKKKKPQQKIVFLNDYIQLRPLPWLRSSLQDHKYNTVPNAVPTQLQRQRHWRADTEKTYPHNPVGIPRKQAPRLLAS